MLGAIAAAVGLMGAVSAEAHTVTYGFTPGVAGSGAVTIWMGSYHFSSENGNQNEGAMDLVGINGTAYASTSHSFDLLSSVLPTGLVEGDNYFCNSTYCPGSGSFASVYFWQGVSITGLTPGDYQFTFTNPTGTTQVFAPWSSNIGAAFTLDEGDIATTSAVPLPAGMTLLLTAAGALGMAARRRKSA